MTSFAISVTVQGTIVGSDLKPKSNEEHSELGLWERLGSLHSRNTIKKGSFDDFMNVTCHLSDQNMNQIFSDISERNIAYSDTLYIQLLLHERPSPKVITKSSGWFTYDATRKT